MAKRSEPRAWRRHLASMLPSRAKIAPTEHRPALSWDIGASMADLRGRDFASGLAQQFTNVTAVQTSEALGAAWGKVDRAKAVWTVPVARMRSHLPSVLRQLIRRKISPEGPVTGSNVGA